MHLSDITSMPIFEKHPVFGAIITMTFMTIGLITAHVKTLLMIDVPIEILHWLQAIAFCTTITVGIMTAIGWLKKHKYIK